MENGVFMKKFAFAFLVIGVIFSMAVCDNGGGGSSGNDNTDTSFDGTWIHSGVDSGELTLNRGNYNYPGISRGTYRTNDNSITFTPTHVHGAFWQGSLDMTRYYTRDEAKAAMMLLLPENPGYTEADIDGFVDLGFVEFSGTLSADGNTLIIPGTGSFTKR